MICSRLRHILSGCPAVLTYPYLNRATKRSLRKRLSEDHEYFYHFTLDRNLEGIRSSGIDPKHEGSDSAYAPRDEPPAMRFCTVNGLQTGLSAAWARNRVYDSSLGIMRDGDASVVLLRVKASKLLSLEFGLDHSFVRDKEVRSEMRDDFLTENGFAGLVQKYGAISCYELVPSRQLQICTTDVEAYVRTGRGMFEHLRRPWWAIRH
jgi:hypothetical protein